REPGPPVEAGEAPHDRDERLLGGVERVGLVPGQAAAEVEDAVVVAAQERVEGGAVTAARGGDQLHVRHLAHGARLLAPHGRPRRTRQRPKARTSATSAAACPAASPRSTIQRSTACPSAPSSSIVFVPAGSASGRATGSPQPARSAAGRSATYTSIRQSLVGLVTCRWSRAAARARVRTRPTPSYRRVT